jgi:hypothetical protein
VGMLQHLGDHASGGRAPTPPRPPRPCR